MRSVAKYLLVPGMIGLLTVIPFVILEWINTNGFRVYGFPAALYAFMWALAFIAASAGRDILASLRSVDRSISSPVKLILSAAVLLIAVTMWSSVIVDQSPCFMGIPNCD
jgi:hypothetical protein